MAHRARVAIVVAHPIQYFSPLFDLVHERAAVELTVVYGNDSSSDTTWDEGFGMSIRWDVDLTGGHPSVSLTSGTPRRRGEQVAGIHRLARLVRSSDVVVVHGYATRLAVLSILLCWVFGVPYLLRGDTSHRALRRRLDPRHWWPRFVCRRSAGALAVGERNSAVMTALGCPTTFFAPFAIDHERFRSVADQTRRDLGRARRDLGVPAGLPVVAFAGKFTEGKRAGDLIAALAELDTPVHVLMIGEGPNRERLEAAASDYSVTFTGFLNQSAMPVALAVADVLVLPSSHEAWGLVVNEALACGCVPVVSDAVGCAPDLVVGLGQVYPVGNVKDLTRSLRLALLTAARPESSVEMLDRSMRYGLEPCAAGYELAVREVMEARKR